MTDQPDYRLYISEKFEGISKLMNAQFENIHDKLDTIEEQTKKTNGRVNDLEDELDAIKEKTTLHVVDCPAKKEVEAIKSELLEYNFLRKYPKLITIVVAIFVVVLFIAAYGTFSTINSNLKAEKTDVTINRINENTK